MTMFENYQDPMNILCCNYSRIVIRHFKLKIRSVHYKFNLLCRVYTTMLGKKSSVTTLKEVLHMKGVRMSHFERFYYYFL